jgi:hypothetical protein
MESIGSSLMLLVLLGGVAILLRAKNRLLGIFLILFAVIFLFIVPFYSFKNYIKNSEGVYKSSSKRAIIIKDQIFTLIDSNAKVVERGAIDYLNIDDYSFHFGQAKIFNQMAMEKLLPKTRYLISE